MAHLFTRLCLVLPQVYAIVTGIGTIDRMRKRGPKGNFAAVPWVDVFGVDPLPMWFLPTDVKYRDFHRVMGYKVATWEIGAWGRCVE